MLATMRLPNCEQAEFEQRLLSQLMASSIPDGIYIKDARRRYIRLNEAEARILGVTSPRAALGKQADRFIAAKRARLWRQEDTRVLVTGEVLTDRIEECVGEDGSVRWLSATKAPIRDRYGAITGIAGITRDVTGAKHVEELKDQFISTLSHELRTPVAAIVGSLALVASGAAGALPNSAARLLKIASANCERLGLLINDVLDTEKLACGMMAFNLQRVDVRPIVEQEIAAIQSFAEPYGVRIGLDRNAADGSVRANSVRLGQVVSNLLSNAVKFSPRGADVVVGIEDRRGSICISIRDHGPGIPPEFKNSHLRQVRAGERRRHGAKVRDGAGA